MRRIGAESQKTPEGNGCLKLCAGMLSAKPYNHCYDVWQHSMIMGNFLWIVRDNGRDGHAGIQMTGSSHDLLLAWLLHG